MFTNIAFQRENFQFFFSKNAKNSLFCLQLIRLHFLNSSIITCAFKRQNEKFVFFLSSFSQLSLFFSQRVVLLLRRRWLTLCPFFTSYFFLFQFFYFIRKLKRKRIAIPLPLAVFLLLSPFLFFPLWVTSREIDRKKKRLDAEEKTCHQSPICLLSVHGISGLSSVPPFPCDNV